MGVFYCRNFFFEGFYCRNLIVPGRQFCYVLLCWVLTDFFLGAILDGVSEAETIYFTHLISNSNKISN